MHRNQKGRYQRSSGKPHDPEDHPFALLTRANVEESLMARMLGGNAAQQFGIELVQTVGA